MHASGTHRVKTVIFSYLTSAGGHHRFHETRCLQNKTAGCLYLSLEPITKDLKRLLFRFFLSQFYGGYECNDHGLVLLEKTGFKIILSDNVYKFPVMARTGPSVNKSLFKTAVGIGSSRRRPGGLSLIAFPKLPRSQNLASAIQSSLQTSSAEQPVACQRGHEAVITPGRWHLAILWVK